MENHKESSLMKKTKKELVEIILRKDDVENRLRKELNDVNLDFSKSKDMIAKKDKHIDELDDTIATNNEQISGLQGCIDDLTTDNNELINCNKKLKVISIVTSVVAALAIVALIVF